MILLRLMQIAAGASCLTALAAFWAVSEGVSCIGYCYGEDKFNTHYVEAKE